MTRCGSLEQGLCAVVMIALQTPDNESPHTTSGTVSGAILARWLGISESYTMKILRRLVVAHIIKSRVHRDGGYYLAKAPEQISVGDIANALGAVPQSISSGLATRIFPDTNHTEQIETLLEHTMTQASQTYLESLNSLTLPI